MSPGRCGWWRRAGWQPPRHLCCKRRGCRPVLALLWLPPALLLLFAAVLHDPPPGHPRQEGTAAVAAAERAVEGSRPPARALPPPEPFAEDQLIVAAEGPASSRTGERRSGRRKRVYRLVRAGKRGRWGAAASLPEQHAGTVPTLERHLRGFDEVVSERISLHRRPPEVRDPLCLQQEYSQNLPSASIIICFHNEAWSTLLRTVNSVMDTAPKKFLKEIILVDDLSNQGHLKAALSEYISRLDGVKLIRSNKRLGVIGGRMLGAARATGDVLIFMDSHCECHNGWLEPLLDRIAFDRTRVVSPVIDVIDWKTFQYYHSIDPQRGVFNWKLDFHWEPIPEYELKWRKSPISPIQSPAISGGVLGINRHYFQNIGAYDPGMLMWGIENVELSLRVWLCGGSVEVLPCSRVGHVYQKHAHGSLLDEETVVKNKIRVAEVWLDSFKEIFYKRDSAAYLLSKAEVPDCKERLQLRKRLSCKNFHWFLTNIYPELYVPEDKPGYSGEARQRFLLYNIGTGFCADYETKWGTSGYPIILAPCSGNGNQHFEYNSVREIRFGAIVELCIDVRDEQVILQNCTRKNRMESQQQWNVQKVGLKFCEVFHMPHCNSGRWPGNPRVEKLSMSFLGSALRE
ncbi:polypeptide N-acetylgalactosaminyltransferase 15-like isoform X2 [Pristis pectinata]|uniref:polypeptide N-acetylgalactosaminyltransferase 15-like isoform X2 n=1 Tax=Pristis pectinata TaxID=685728 RepID=UPI00223E6CBF|nr:polypeptide N-acetylgalactosaminyltransferase 15-like isoform X2 [Pristis pectinata]